MKKTIPVLTALMLLITFAHGGNERDTWCADGDEDCIQVSRLRLNDDGVQVLFLGDNDDEPSFVPLTRFMSQRGYLGVSLTDLTPELRDHFGVDAAYGVMVSRVEDDSPAAEAGLEVGDVITLVDGREVHHGQDVARIVREKEAGDPIDIEVWRDGRPRNLNATAARREKPQLDLSGLGALHHLGEMDLGDLGIDADSISRTVEEALKGIEDVTGRFHFNFDPETAEEFRQRWEVRKKEGDGPISFFGNLENMEEQMAKRMQELEKRLKELEQELQSRER